MKQYLVTEEQLLRLALFHRMGIDVSEIERDCRMIEVNRESIVLTKPDWDNFADFVLEGDFNHLSWIRNILQTQWEKWCNTSSSAKSS